LLNPLAEDIASFAVFGSKTSYLAMKDNFSFRFSKGGLNSINAETPLASVTMVVDDVRVAGSSFF
jgi:hypothetical protein